MRVASHAVLERKTRAAVSSRGNHWSFKFSADGKISDNVAKMNETGVCVGLYVKSDGVKQGVIQVIDDQNVIIHDDCASKNITVPHSEFADKWSLVMNPDEVKNQGPIEVRDLIVCWISFAIC